VLCYVFLRIELELIQLDFDLLGNSGCSGDGDLIVPQAPFDGLVLKPDPIVNKALRDRQDRHDFARGECLAFRTSLVSGRCCRPTDNDHAPRRPPFAIKTKGRDVSRPFSVIVSTRQPIRGRVKP